MMRVALTAVAVLLCTLCASAIPVSDVFGDDRSLTKGNFSLTNKGVWLIEYYAPWCPHCRAFAPQWHKLVERVDYMSKDPVNPYTLARVDCVAEAALCREQHVDSFPMAKLYKNGKMVMDNVFAKTSRDIKKLEEFIFEGYAALHPDKASLTPPGGAPSNKLQPVKELTEFGQAPIETQEDLNRFLGKDEGQGPSLIKFYSPWCPHCRAMEADYANAAREMVGQVNPLAVDCNKYSDVCQEFGVEGWPHVKLAFNGEYTTYPDDDQFGREKDQFLAWLRVMNVLDAIHEVTASMWYTVVRKKKQTVLFVGPSSEDERQLVQKVRSRINSDTQFLTTKDPALLHRFGHNKALLVFNENIHLPSAVLPLVNAAGMPHQQAVDKITEWIDNQNKPPVQQVMQLTAGESLHQLPGVVVVALNSKSNMFDKQVEQMRKLSQKWRSSPNLAHKSYSFLFYDMNRDGDLLKEVFDISVKSAPSLYVLSDLDGQVYMYPSITRSMNPEKILNWLEDVDQGRVEGGTKDSLLARTMEAGASSTENVSPFLLLILLVAVLFLIPRVRRFIFRLFSSVRSNRKIV